MHNNNSIYCVKPDNAVGDENGLFQRMPYNLANEAAALGATVQTTASGFMEVIPFIKSPEQLLRLPRLSESEQIKNNLANIRELSKKQPFMANAIAPYSLLTMITSVKLMAWLVRYPDETLSALWFCAAELSWYICELFIARSKSCFSIRSARATGAYRRFPLCKILRWQSNGFVKTNIKI